MFDKADPSTDIYVDSAKKATFKPSEAEFYVIRDEVSEKLIENWDVKKVERLRTKRKILHITECSDLLDRLPNIEIVRVYAELNRKDAEKAEEICRKIYNEFREEEGEENE
ncbi:hypothetical protein [Archaeoglobus veneficus]|uniref:hypothetical protein n=1 Tax=Archaeoglobus veneficus TaxID=58290 RepID=UPI000AC5B86D|nr:hypothetical protein [Archaeoglobus veneficus]